MKKFKNVKAIKSFENEKLTSAEMYRLSGGMIAPPPPKKTKGPLGIYNDDGCIPNPFPVPLPPIIKF